MKIVLAAPEKSQPQMKKAQLVSWAFEFNRAAS